VQINKAMGKKLNMNSMDKLISGLTGKEQISMANSGSSSNVASGNKESSPQQEATHTETSKKTVKQHICATVEKMDKIRAIAALEGLNINSILDLALLFVINKYEELHGEINILPKKGDVGKVFNL